MFADFTKNVRYELMYGYQAIEELKKCGIVYLPLGCLELHGSHLPMGLDVIKAHNMCCLLAQCIGGVVFPPHYYSGVHLLEDEVRSRFAREWGNVYTEDTAKASIIEVVMQIKRIGAKICVLYSGHYPMAQIDMVNEIASETDNESEGFRVIVCPERDLCDGGDHAGVYETSLLLYLDRHSVNMSAIYDQGYKDHRWTGYLDPKLASSAKGEGYAFRIVEYMKEKIRIIKN